MDEKEYKGHKFKPETLMLGYGYNPFLSEGSAKPPVFLTSTFVFPTAEKGKNNFEIFSGLREKEEGEIEGLIYSRMNNPGLEILEERLALWDNMQKSLVFASGMSAISSFMFSFTKPGDAVISSNPIYGGTHGFFNKILSKFDIKVYYANSGSEKEDFENAIKQAQSDGREVKIIFIETPANPTNVMTDLEMISKLAKEYSTNDNKIITAVDNTFLGPVFQHPGQFGIDAVIYSATKFIGGHSDLIGGVVSTSKNLAKKVAFIRQGIGTMTVAFDAWLMMRSLETLKIRMQRQQENAKKIAQFLEEHPKIEYVNYPTLWKKGTRQYEIYKKQSEGPGSLITIRVKGGEKEAFKFLDSVKLCKLAVSLGGTETLIQHPKGMTHISMDPKEQERIGIFDNTVRLSVGVEDPEDLIFDLDQALSEV
jgi:methionine-gamma-lyase